MYDQETQPRRRRVDARGSLSNSGLAKEALKDPEFRNENFVSIEKDVDRFADRYEQLNILSRKDGKLCWTSFERGADSEMQKQPFVLTSKGFLTSRAGVKCDHCGNTIDLSQVKMKWRPKSRILALALHVHHIFRVVCPRCGWVGRYNIGRDVKPILSD